MKYILLKLLTFFVASADKEDVFSAFVSVIYQASG